MSWLSRPLPPRQKETPTSIGCGIVVLLFVIVPWAGGFIGSAIGGADGAHVGAITGWGLAVSIIVGGFLAHLYRHGLKPATEQESAVLEAIYRAVTTLLLWLAAAALIVTDFIEDPPNRIREAVHSAAERQPGTFWLAIGVAVALGVVSGYRTIRAAVQRASSESATRSQAAVAEPQKGESDRGDASSTGISEKPPPSSL
jgi:hypothetical protein